MIKPVITGILCLCISLAYGQSGIGSDRAITSDRPGISDTPLLISQGDLQVETGINYDYQRKRNLINRKYTYNIILIRYGIGANFELRLQNEYSQYKISDNGNFRKINTMGPAGIGYKIRITEQKGVIPALAMIGSFNLPFTVRQELRPEYFGSFVKFAACNTLSDRLALTYNVGVEWDGSSPNANIQYAICMDANIYKGLAVFIESYGEFSEVSYPHHYADAGVFLIVKKIIQFDVSGGLVLGEHQCSGFIGGGCSWLLKRK